MSYLISVFFIMGLVGPSVYAEKSNHFVLVTHEHPLQQEIDKIFNEFLSSKLSETFCGILRNPVSASYSFGMSPSAALLAFRNCKSVDSSDIAKRFPKKYILSWDKPAGLDSWTSLANETTIFYADNLDYNRLKSILLHELAVTSDAKSSMNYIRYATYQYKSQSKKSKNGSVYVDLNDPEVKAINKAFNIANWPLIHLSLASLRGFAFEGLYHTGEVPIQSHKQCVKEVTQIFHLVEKSNYLLHADKLKSQNPSTQALEGLFQDMLSLFSSRELDEMTLEQGLNYILDSSLKLKDHSGKSITFCQYMTLPLISNQNVDSFFSHGPRPRLTGGSGGQQ